MTSCLQQLIDTGCLAPPGSRFDWESVEDRLRTPVPTDYRKLLDAGGGGLWLDYIRLFVPGAGSRSGRDLAESGLEFEQLRELWEDEVIGRPSDLASDTRLLPWASTGAGVTFYWEVSGTPSGAYPIRVSDPDGVEWGRYDLLTTDLLLGIVRGEIRDAVLNPSWFDFGMIFRPYSSRADGLGGEWDRPSDLPRPGAEESTRTAL